MKRLSLLAASVSAAACGAMTYAAAPAATPIADYWMDVATTSGLGAGMAAGGQPDMGQVMSMMRGGGSAVGRTIDLRLASKQKPAAAAQADHMVPAGLRMGPSLPLTSPRVVRHEAVAPGPAANYQPKGRMLIYWSCGEHVGAAQPMVIDFSKVAAGKAPAGMKAMASVAKVVSGPHSAPGFGRWPNERDSRAVPAAGSLLGAHQVQANYAPQIAFSLGTGQDFMPGLGLREAGSLPSGATRLQWTPAQQATGYALAMFGASASGDTIMWSSSKSASMATLDYVAPAEVKRLVAAGQALPSTESQCILPAEVATAMPAGMITMIGYGPEANFSDNPKAPKWRTKVRFKSTASLMRGMSAMQGESDVAGQPPQPPAKKKKKRFGLGDLIEGATGIPIPR